MSSHVIGDRKTELALGIAAFILGAWLIHDAYEGRGKTRPFALRFLPS